MILKFPQTILLTLFISSFISCTHSLNDGDSPYDHFFGESVFDSEMLNEITFKNNTDRDAIICLLDTVSNETIRNEYIRTYSIYKMENVPNGVYFMKVFYGSDWDMHALLNEGKIRGGFTNNVSYSISDRENEHITMEHYSNDEGSQWSVWSVSLKSENGNIEPRDITENTFFN